MTPGKIILFSDVHLGTSQCNRYAFQKFVDWLARDPPGRIIILGDLLDFWRRSNNEVLRENKEVLNELFSLDCPIDYVVGNHDYAIIDIAERNGKTISLSLGDVRFCRTLRFKCGTSRYFATHGYELDCAVTMEELPLETYEAFAAAMCRAGDDVGGLASLLWSGLTISPLHLPALHAVQRHPSHRDQEYDAIYQTAVSGAAHLFLGAQPRDKIIYGHTHWPDITKDRCVANTGSWCTEPGIPRHNTYVEITPEGMVLKQFLPGDFPTIHPGNLTK